MEEKERCPHDHPGPVGHKLPPATHPFPVILVPCGTTSNRMVDMGRIDAPKTVQAQKAHEGHDEKNSWYSKSIANKTT